MSLLLALPKGRLLNEVKVLLEKVGIEFDDKSRKLIINTSKDFIKVAILRTWDIPKFVNYGAADIGVVGKDILMEKEDEEFVELLDLEIGKCRLSLAGKNKLNSTSSRLRVATKYPKSAISYMNSIGIQAEIIYLHGSQEIAPVLGLADVIIDLVDTGNTLKENGMKELDKISDISTRLIVNKASLKTRSRLIDEITDALK